MSSQHATVWRPELSITRPAKEEKRMSLSIATPLLGSLTFSQRHNTSVWLKMEAMQPSGSFKMRGIGHACEVHQARGARRFIASSGGNAGLAVACAGRLLGVPVVVVVPETTSLRARHLLTQQGADVRVHGASWTEANALAHSLLSPEDAFIHPFDDPLLWEGHASMIDEIVAAGVHPDAIVLSVGGGGLLAGVDEGLLRNGLHDTTIFAIETEGMSSYRAALEAGRPVPLPSLSGIATTLGASQICQRAFDASRHRTVIPVTVTDAEAVEACLRFIDDQRTLIEPACGAALAMLDQSQPCLSGYKNIVVIVCGGSTTTLETLQAFRAEFALA